MSISRSSVILDHFKYEITDEGIKIQPKNPKGKLKEYTIKLMKSDGKLAPGKTLDTNLANAERIKQLYGKASETQFVAQKIQEYLQRCRKSIGSSEEKKAAQWKVENPDIAEMMDKFAPDATDDSSSVYSSGSFGGRSVTSLDSILEEHESKVKLKEKKEEEEKLVLLKEQAKLREGITHLSGDLQRIHESMNIPIPLDTTLELHLKETQQLISNHTKQIQKLEDKTARIVELTKRLEELKKAQPTTDSPSLILNLQKSLSELLEKHPEEDLSVIGPMQEKLSQEEKEVEAKEQEKVKLQEAKVKQEVDELQKKEDLLKEQLKGLKGRITLLNKEKLEKTALEATLRAKLTQGTEPKPSEDGWIYRHRWQILIVVGAVVTTAGALLFLKYKSNADEATRLAQGAIETYRKAAEEAVKAAVKAAQDSSDTLAQATAKLTEEYAKTASLSAEKAIRLAAEAALKASEEAAKLASQTTQKIIEEATTSANDVLSSQITVHCPGIWESIAMKTNSIACNTIGWLGSWIPDSWKTAQHLEEYAKTVFCQPDY